ncbi:unnamed protein product [Linum tenue]|uniref:Uncharacterized protein n=1 Tax=Linum tenue TaxID=586396 RepID=A0AAV0GNT0_9ROSI|nr:unnamed protein product [Linum tenue]
MSTSRRSPSSR